MILGHDKGERLAFARGFTFYVDELRHVNHGIENNQECFRQLQRKHSFLARGKLDRIECDFLD